MYNTKELPLYKAITSEEHIIANSISKLIPPNSKILDIGCGSGSIALKIKNKTSKVSFDAVELDISQIKINYVFDKIYNLSFQDFEFEQEYDIILLSHVLGHFSSDFRYTKLLNKIINKNPNSKIIIVTNALVNEFKTIQECIWDITGDKSYFIDLKKLLNPILNKHSLSFEKLSVELTHEDKLTFYRLLETFSPIPLSDYPTKLISEKIEKHLYINNRYILNIPQFVISIEVNKIESTKYNNLNHSALWENII